MSRCHVVDPCLDKCCKLESVPCVFGSLWIPSPVSKIPRPLNSLTKRLCFFFILEQPTLHRCPRRCICDGEMSRGTRKSWASRWAWLRRWLRRGATGSDLQRVDLERNGFWKNGHQFSRWGWTIYDRSLFPSDSIFSFLSIHSDFPFKKNSQRFDTLLLFNECIVPLFLWYFLKMKVLNF